MSLKEKYACISKLILLFNLVSFHYNALFSKEALISRIIPKIKFFRTPQKRYYFINYLKILRYLPTKQFFLRLESEKFRREVDRKREVDDIKIRCITQLIQHLELQPNS